MSKTPGSTGKKTNTLFNYFVKSPASSVKSSRTCPQSETTQKSSQKLSEVFDLDSENENYFSCLRSIVFRLQYVTKLPQHLQNWISLLEIWFGLSWKDILGGPAWCVTIQKRVSDKMFVMYNLFLAVFIILSCIL